MKFKSHRSTIQHVTKGIIGIQVLFCYMKDKICMIAAFYVQLQPFKDSWYKLIQPLLNIIVSQHASVIDMK